MVLFGTKVKIIPKLGFFTNMITTDLRYDDCVLLGFFPTSA